MLASLFKKRFVFGIICFLPWLISIIINYSINLEFFRFYIYYILYGIMFGFLGFIGAYLSTIIKNKKLVLVVRVLTIVIALIPGILQLLVVIYGLLFPIT